MFKLANHAAVMLPFVPALKTQSSICNPGRDYIRERKLNTNFFFLKLFGHRTAGISRQNPGISRQKSLISMVSRDIPNFLAPTPSCGRPLTHRKISGLKSLGLGSFFVPDIYAPPPSPHVWPEGIFEGRGGGGVYFEAPHGRSFIHPPLLYTPHPWKGIFRGGGWGYIKFGPVFNIVEDLSSEYFEGQNPRNILRILKTFGGSGFLRIYENIEFFLFVNFQSVPGTPRNPPF